MTIAGPALDLTRLRIIPQPSETCFSDFKSGEREIDRNLGKCWDWHCCHRSRTFCAYFEGDPTLYGFFCLGLHAHDAAAVEGIFAKARDDSRSFVPFIYINYLAVRDGCRRKKIGTMLLMNALERCAVVIRNIGAYGVALNALNDDAAGFYDHHDFRVKERGSRAKPLMVLPAQSVLDIFRA